MRILRSLVISPEPPSTDAVWFSKGTLKYFNDGGWITIGGGEGGGVTEDDMKDYVSTQLTDYPTQSQVAQQINNSVNVNTIMALFKPEEFEVKNGYIQLKEGGVLNS